MTEASDRQLDELFKADPAEYRRTLRTALGVMVNDQLPAAGDVVVVSQSSEQPSNDYAKRETGTLSRRDAGEAVPYILMVPKDWDGTVVIWVDPGGSKSLDFKDYGVITRSRFLHQKAAVICADLFGTGEFTHNIKPVPALAIEGYAKQKYAGFLHGYNRGILANRVHDLLTEIAFARSWKGTTKVHLMACANSGPESLLARALAGNAIDRCAIDLADVDFNKVTDDHDSMMLPGALKYGGIAGFVPLCDSGKTNLYNFGGNDSRIRATANIAFEPKSLPLEKATAWLLAADGE
jgi:hypothetical protein